MSEECDTNEALGFDWIDGRLEPILKITPEMEMMIYAAGQIGPEGLKIAYSKPDGC